MGELPIDERPTAEPSCFSYHEPGEGDWVYEARKRDMEIWRGEVAEGRWTLVTDADDDPHAGYQPGLYFEGWKVAPHMMEPPHKPARFNYPCVAAEAPKP